MSVYAYFEIYSYLKSVDTSKLDDINLFSLFYSPNNYSERILLWDGFGLWNEYSLTNIFVTFGQID